LFNGAGLNFDNLVRAAAQPGFKAVPIRDIRASTRLSNTVRTSPSNNVIAMIPGSERPEPPKRSVVFLAVTAEESGLLGAQWYTENPVFPLSKTVANINIDAPAVTGPTNDMEVIGYGNSELEDYLRDALAKQPGRYIAAEPNPERGYYYRSDHLNFARQGVPALYAKSGQDSAEHGPEWGAAQSQDYADNRYHSPADEYDPRWDLRGLVMDIDLYFDIGHRLSQENSWPNWFDGNEFKAIRDSSAADRIQ